MPAVSGSNLTLSDIMNQLDSGGALAKVVEILNETNQILDDAVFIEGNLETGHKHIVRADLPVAYWRMLNQGVPSGKSRTVTITDTCGMLEVYSKVDKSLADLGGRTAQVRVSQDRAFLEGMSQQMAKAFIYGNTVTDPERIMGFAPRYSAISGASNRDNVLDGGGTGSTNTSLYLVVWGDEKVNGIFPKGSKGGFTRTDKGQETLSDGNGGEFEGYRTHYKWDTGLTVADWRYVVRICNVDVNALKKDAATGADLIDLITQALEIVPNLNGKPALYCNRTISSFLRRQINNAKNVNLTLDTVAGRKVLQFDGVPIRRVDQIINAEARIV